jgi:hypothetical protein
LRPPTLGAVAAVAVAAVAAGVDPNPKNENIEPDEAAGLGDLFETHSTASVFAFSIVLVAAFMILSFFSSHDSLLNKPETEGVDHVEGLNILNAFFSFEPDASVDDDIDDSDDSDDEFKDDKSLYFPDIYHIDRKHQKDINII